jgi:rubrerythrin
MKKCTKTGHAGAPASGGSAAAVSAAPAARESITAANLQTAYNGETNAHSRYLAFARVADDEGYAPVASLFRAAARAEEIHAKNHAEVIRGLGLEPKAITDPLIVTSTRDNLGVAIKGEVYERDEMYPKFLLQARAAGNHAAVRTFHLAQKAETEHAALFTHALHELERLRGGAIAYYVCPVCGFTAAKTDNSSRCPVCSTPTDRFESVR